jgi:hypothetical protein
MILFLEIVLGWFITGVIAFIWAWRVFHKPENEEKVNLNMQELSNDVGISGDDCKVITYLVIIFFGFLIIPIALIRKILKIRKDI